MKPKVNKMTYTQCEKLRQWLNMEYYYKYHWDEDTEYYPFHSVTHLKRGFIRNLATAIFDHRCAPGLKQRLPRNIYIRVLEAFANRDHDT